MVRRNNDSVNWQRSVDEAQKLQKRIVRGGRPRNERRLAARVAALPDDRVCPCCEALTINIHSWIVGLDCGPICKKCYYRKRVSGEVVRLRKSVSGGRKRGTKRYMLETLAGLQAAANVFKSEVCDSVSEFSWIVRQAHYELLRDSINE